MLSACDRNLNSIKVKSGILLQTQSEVSLKLLDLKHTWTKHNKMYQDGSNIIVNTKKLHIQTSVDIFSLYRLMIVFVSNLNRHLVSPPKEKNKKLLK